MMRKTEREFKRSPRSWDRSSFLKDRHTERVKRQTWWLFGVVPVYSRDTIVASNL